jgi:hypothetical protein
MKNKQNLGSMKYSLSFSQEESIPFSKKVKGLENIVVQPMIKGRKTHDISRGKIILIC